MPPRVALPILHQELGRLAAASLMEQRVKELDDEVRGADGAGGLKGQVKELDDEVRGIKNIANNAFKASEQAGAQSGTALLATERARGAALALNLVDRLDSITRAAQGAGNEKAQHEAAQQRLEAYRRSQNRSVFTRADAFFRRVTEDSSLRNFWTGVVENDLAALDKPEAWHASGEAQAVVERLRDKLADLISPGAEAG